MRRGQKGQRPGHGGAARPAGKGREGGRGHDTGEDRRSKAGGPHGGGRPETGGRPEWKKKPYGTFKATAFKGAVTRPFGGKPSGSRRDEARNEAGRQDAPRHREPRGDGTRDPAPRRDGDDKGRSAGRTFKGTGKGTGFKGPGFKSKGGPFKGKGGPFGGKGKPGGERRPPGRDDGTIRSDPLKRSQHGPYKGPGKGQDQGARTRQGSGKGQGDRPGNRHGNRPGQPFGQRADQRSSERGGDRGDRPQGKSPGWRGDKSSGKTGGPPRGTERDGARPGRREGGALRDRKAAGWHPGKSDAGRSPAPGSGAPAEPMRIAKAIARAGLCSRREAERWIEEGRVAVNGKVLGSPAFEVGPRDKVVVDGQPLPEAEGVRLWRYHKPRGLVTTHNDPEGRPTVFDNLPPDLPRVISIGRLDFNTEGLLLLTNDGELARHLELPSTGWLRRYRVRARGRVTQAQLDALKDGVSVEGINYGPVEASLDSEQGANIWLTIGLREGKNREIRKILASLGLEVSRLIRVSFGPFQLLELEPGHADRIRRRTLREQLGPRIAREMGLIEGTEALDAPPREGASKPRTKDASASAADEFDAKPGIDE